MARTDRAVAQRLGTKQKSRRRGARQAPETPASVERILDEVAPRPAGPASEADATVRPAGAAASAAPAGAVGAPSLARRTGAAARSGFRPAPARRRFAEYAAEYAYVWSDLRRILVVAGALLVVLIALSFVVG